MVRVVGKEGALGGEGGGGDCSSGIDSSRKIMRLISKSKCVEEMCITLSGRFRCY